jgi:hypothetical protein
MREFKTVKSGDINIRIYVAHRQLTHKLGSSISDHNAFCVLPSAPPFSVRHWSSPCLIGIVPKLVRLTIGGGRTGMTGVVGWGM